MICNIIVITIIVKSSAVDGDMEYHQSHIHSVSVTRLKTGSHLRKPTGNKLYLSELCKWLSYKKCSVL